jgi:hypothetical protein
MSRGSGSVLHTSAPESAKQNEEPLEAKSGPPQQAALLLGQLRGFVERSVDASAWGRARF